MEHLQHFGLSQDPFSNEPDLRFYFESASHLDAQRRVERGLRQHKGLTLLTGDGGMGKTLLARRILDALEEEVFEATLLVMLPGAADATGILQRFARQLGCEEPAEDRAGLLGQIYEQLAIVREDGRHAVLMIDDAQIMTPEVFAELSGLLNLEYEDRRLISMLFVGSPELDQLVQNDASIMPRVDVRVRLQPLDLENASAYVAHRMNAAQANASILPPAAIDALYKFGRGRPRLLNTLADNALFEAYLAGRMAIEPTDIERAAGDLGIGPDPGSTYSQLTTAPVPPAISAPQASPTPSVASAAAAAAPSMGAEITMPGGDSSPSLELDDSLEELDLTPDMESSPGAVSPTLDLDAGLDDALGDLDVGAEEAIPMADPVVDAATSDSISFDLEGDANGVEDGLEFMDALPTSPAPPAAGGGEPAMEIVEAELTPLEMGDGDELDDAFVELIDG